MKIGSQTKKSKIRVVFFDVHDTLIYINQTPPEIFQILCQESGVGVDLNLLKKLYLNPNDLERRREAFGNDVGFWMDLNARLLTQLEISDPDQSLVKKIVEGFKEVRWWDSYPDAISTLQKLKVAKYQLGVIANSRHLVIGRLDHTGLTSFFDTITYSEEVGASKPDRRIFEAALQRAGCQPQEAIHIGDRWVEDIEGARNAGIKPVLLDRKSEHPHASCARVQTLEEIFQFL
ncbi:HAD-IA family hydrolase [Candidatus Acetothermia bacterium]|nr:HAD-IA family hydrolase [Candidatus Acetothermia bacterium]MBI3643052.1 HAD-IA family hydrolase [Candidatus Acetothermia bacterium]